MSESAIESESQSDIITDQWGNQAKTPESLAAELAEGDRTREAIAQQTREIADKAKQRREALERGEDPDAKPETGDTEPAKPEISRRDVNRLAKQNFLQEQAALKVEAELAALGKGNVYDPNLSQDEFVALRNAQERLGVNSGDARDALLKAKENARNDARETLTNEWQDAHPQPEQQPEAPLTPDFSRDPGTFEAAVQAEADRREQAQMVQDFGTRMAEIRANDPVFQQLQTNPLPHMHAPLHPELHDALIELEEGPQLVAYLAKYPAEMAKLQGMRPKAQVAALGYIVASMEQEARTWPKVSRAPEPIATAKLGHKAASFNPNDESLSPDDWARKRNADLRKRNKA